MRSPTRNDSVACGGMQSVRRSSDSKCLLKIRPPYLIRFSQAGSPGLHSRQSGEASTGAIAWHSGGRIVPASLLREIRTVTELITIMVFANHASAIGLLLFGAWQRAAVDGLCGHALERAPLRGAAPIQPELRRPLKHDDFRFVYILSLRSSWRIRLG